MTYIIEIPSDAVVVQALNDLGGSRVTATRLCEALVVAGYPRRDSQLAIQRAAERGHIIVGSDWTLSSAPEAVAA